MAFDMVIRNGTVVDGTGLPSYRADVGITGDRIARIGRIGEKGRVDLDADGHAVTPGFIDGHTHMDAQVMWDPLGSCSCWHGVTSVVMGNCGFTLAPGAADTRALVVRNLERAEDISAEAMAAGIDWTWETYAEYLDAVQGRPKAINYAGYVGHSALRTWAMGERAFEQEATPDDLAKMEHGLAGALRAGAVGLSSSRSENHATSDDRPVASRLASWEEFSRLVGAMGSMGGGLVSVAPAAALDSSDPVARAAVSNPLRKLAVDSGCPIMFGIAGLTYRDRLAVVDGAAAAGGRMLGQVSSRGISAILSFKTQLPFDRLPEWARVRALPLDEQRRVFSDPAARRLLVDAAGAGSYGGSIGAESPAPDYDAMTVLERPLPPNPSVRALATTRGLDPVELMIDLALGSDFDQLFAQPLPGCASADEDLLAMMRHPRTVMTFCDSGAHVSQISDASIQTHLLGYWVRDRQAFTLEEAVRMLTLEPATAFGMSARGLVREGMVADLNVFDPERVTPELPVLVHDLPAGAGRLIQRSRGFLATIVAGETTFREGEHTGAFPGRVLRAGRYR